MSFVSRRIVPLAAILAVAATLAVWITAGAATSRSNPAVPPTMHFRAVQTSAHFSPNGSTQRNPTGATYQLTLDLVSGRTKIGTAFLNATVMNKTGLSLESIEARFPHRGRIELQGTAPANGGGQQTITGGTGVFTHATGWAIGHHRHVTVTFR